MGRTEIELGRDEVADEDEDSYEATEGLDFDKWATQDCRNCKQEFQ